MLDLHTLTYLMLIINCMSFSLMAYDKHCAKQRMWRVPEFHFFVLSSFGGWGGVWFGGILFRHKTRKRSFQLKILLGLLFSIALYLFIQ